MATFLTDLRADIANPKDMLDGKLTKGRINHTLATWTMTGSGEATNDVVEIISLPEGSTIIPTECKLIIPVNPGSTLDIEIGDVEDTNRYMLATDVSAGGVFGWLEHGTSAANTPAGGTPYAIESSANYRTIEAKITSGSPSVTADEKVIFSVAWVHG